MWRTQNFLTFNRSAPENCTGDAGTATIQNTQDTSVAGSSLSDVTGMTSQSSGSADVSHAGPTTQVTSRRRHRS